MTYEVSITNPSGHVTCGMRHPAAPSHPATPSYPGTPGYPTTTSDQQPPVSQQPSGLSDTPKSQINKDRDRDLSECEREAAFAGAGDKRQVFNNCMKARGY
jgi:hypothetical protein